MLTNLHQPDTLHIHMPVYNGEQYVGAAIDAVLADMEASGIADFRLMIGDDASTDTTPEILVAYAQHPSITVVTHANNLGVGGNRARLLETTLQEAELPRETIRPLHRHGSANC